MKLRPGMVAAVALVLVLGLAAPVMALWNDSASASHQISTGTLPPPTSPTIARESCVTAVSTSIRVSWTGSPATWVGGYRVSIGLIAGGPYTTVIDVGPSASSVVVTGLAFSLQYYAIVQATKGAWTSAPTSEVSVLTPTTLCV